MWPLSAVGRDSWKVSHSSAVLLVFVDVEEWEYSEASSSSVLLEGDELSESSVESSHRVSGWSGEWSSTGVRA